MRSPLRPGTTLAQVFGPGVVYVPRRSPTNPGWSPGAPGQIDFLTGLQLGIAGGMPCVASAATVTPVTLELRAEAGLPVNAELHSYRSVPEYLALIAGLADQGYRLATQRVHPENEVPSSAATPPSGVQSALNDKGRMEELVPGEWLPRRRTIAVRDLPGPGALLSDGTPVVLKAATEKPSGGGHCVWICRTAGDLDAARQALADEARVVIEEFLDHDVSLCVHGVVYPDASTAHFGAAEEIVRNGRWLGNWHDESGDMVPEAVLTVVSDIVSKAASAGYRGITGVDVARLRDGTWRVLDLNFRVNGSTAGAWLRASIEESRGVRVIRGRSWACAGGFETLVRIVRAAVRRGTLVPLGLYDPSACETGGQARVGGLLLGSSRSEIEREYQRLVSEGLE